MKLLLMSVMTFFLLFSAPSYAQSQRDLVLSTETTSEYFEPITPWMPSINTTTGAQAFIFLLEKTGNFRVRLGIQVANTTMLPSTPGALASQSAYISTAGPTNGTLYRFNPNDATDGNIDTAAWYRLGVLYSLSASGSGSGSVRIEALAHE